MDVWITAMVSRCPTPEPDASIEPEPVPELKWNVELHAGMTLPMRCKGRPRATETGPAMEPLRSLERPRSKAMSSGWEATGTISFPNPNPSVVTPRNPYGPT